ncbi:hypothetical protein [Mycolicibacterium moriokaense]|uniref:Methionine synthase n=1 Tax=Mycolicibacterium moriokaense TaxID=39691 RepID=A0A318H6J1_9MYCO|nr:hypothetical protein [Mycolicibacterium moriokaense]PXW99859.1 hypothetical protein C8E89_13915 [Mycolicibacterium moriokaense]
MSTSTTVHLCGSIPLPDVAQVFTLAAQTLGDRVSRLPDGEIAERRFFIDWHIPVVGQAREYLEYESPARGKYPQLPSYRLRKNADPDKIQFGPFGYAQWASESYQVFRRLKDEGVIPAQTRFQVNLPLALTPCIAIFADPETSAAVEPAYERALLAEVEQIGAAIPAHELTLQTDLVFELAHWERLFPPFHGGDPEQGVIDRMEKFAQAVPAQAEFGVHLCYGDYQHEHFMQPKDLGTVTQMSNAFARFLSHPLAYVHVPVPRDRNDKDYFAPLSQLRLDPNTELYLGLVHATDGVEGTMQRVRAARSVTDNFGIATECGFGRRPPETVEPLLELHRTVSDRMG